MTHICKLAFMALLLCACAVQATPPPTAQIPATIPPSAIPPTQPAPLPPAAPTTDARPLIQSPRWFDQALVYEIFPRSFYDASGDGVGDLRGIMMKLDYLQSLGVNTLWLTPHYPSTTYHGYDVVDYTAVNPQFGTLEDFKALSAELKRRNMRLIVDFVPNHSSNAHPYFKDAYKNPASKFASWYAFNDPKHETYASFFGVANLPEWNHANPAVRKYLIDSALFWLDAGADGLRCDHALGVENPFWLELRAAVKARHPEAVILGEVWDGSVLKLNEYFNTGFDALFDFPWYLALNGGADKVGEGVLNGRPPIGLLSTPHRVTQRLYPRGAQLLHFASNHDTNRIASSVSGDMARMRLAAASALLLPGVPMIYYGEEIGMRGVKGPGPIYDEYRREPMDWYADESGAGMTRWFKPADRANKPRDGVSVDEQESAPNSLLNLYRVLARTRGSVPALRGAQFAFLETPACESCLLLWRFDDARKQRVLIGFNFSANPVSFTLAEGSLPSGPHSPLIGRLGLDPTITLDAWGWGAQSWP